MAKKKSETAVKEYEVLIQCGNGQNEFAVGAKVTVEDFPQAAIDNWLRIEPPVLKEVD